MNFKNRVLLVLLADIIAVSVVTCNAQNRNSEQYTYETSIGNQLSDDELHNWSTNEKKEETIPPFIDSSYEQIEETTPILTPEKMLELKLTERLYDENIDYKLVVKTYLDAEYDSRDSMKDDYLRALYMLMLNSGISIQTYIDELHNLLVMQQIPTELPEDIWYNLFGNLIVLSNGYPSLFEMFIDFATYVHELSCEEEHFINDYYAYSCKKLEMELKLIKQ